MTSGRKLKSFPTISCPFLLTVQHCHPFLVLFYGQSEHHRSIIKPSGPPFCWWGCWAQEVVRRSLNDGYGRVNLRRHLYDVHGNCTWQQTAVPSWGDDTFSIIYDDKRLEMPEWFFDLWLLDGMQHRFFNDSCEYTWQANTKRCLLTCLRPREIFI